MASLPGRGDQGGGDTALDLVELLFFAYRDFVGDADRILAEFGLGRAHHRALHFVTRRPGLRVAELLEVLRITKQSLNGVLKELVRGGLIEQRPGETDRRQRLLYPTPAGRELAERLARVQAARIEAALPARSGARNVVAEFLRHMADTGANDRVRAAPSGAKVAR